MKAVCTYHGLFFLLSGAGPLGTGGEAFLLDQLAHTNALWRVCAWHKNLAAMQFANKSDEVG